MMPSLINAGMVGAPYNHVSGGGYTVDTMFNELSRQLLANTRRYSRASNGHQRMGSAMKISKPGSASNSPRSSTLQARRKTLIGDGFRGGFQTQSPAMDQMHHPMPTSDTPFESTTFERATTARATRPVSWHPSSQNTQSLFPQDNGNAILYPYAAYHDAEALASLTHFPPTPAVYSGYASPVESFSPLSLPYSNLGSQPMCSPLSQPLPTPLEQQPQHTYPSASCSMDYASAGALSDVPYLPPPRVADDAMCWESYPNNALFHRPTAPPTPEDFACSMVPKEAAETRTYQEQPQQTQQQQPAKQETTQNETYQPLIHDDDADDESEGEILYGMGLYDAPDHSKGSALHQSVVLSLLGGARDQAEDVDTGKGLGLKLEDAWEPPANEDEDSDEGSGDDAEEREE